MSTLLLTPSLPDISKAFGTLPGNAQSLVTLYLLAFAISQLVFGGTCDQIGRRPTLLGGLTLFGIASVACAFAPTMAFLQIARILQACGASAIVVSVYAILRDTNDAEGFAKAGSTLAIITGSIPAIAPMIGGYLSKTVSWRGNFVIMALLATSLLVLTRLYIRETIHAKSRFNFVTLFRNYATLLMEPRFAVQAIAAGAVIGGLYAYNAGVPFMLTDLFGVDATRVGFVTGLSVPAFLAGSYLGRIALKRLTPERVAQIGTLTCVAGGLLFFALARGNLLSISSIVLSFSLFALGMGLSIPNIMASALRFQQSSAGAGTAVLGLAQTFGGALFTFLLSLTASPTSNLPTLICVCGFVAASAFNVSLLFKGAKRP
ncbi:multidrug effflux MFS transporter [Rhizobium sp. P38BS-XIX]|nr:multidrug effflux MFS transporter [Rhizobium sp. P38BS-XIX]